MKHLFSIVIFLTTIFSLKAQVTADIITKYNSDTINICTDTIIKFVAVVKNGTDTVSENADIYWDFGDGDFSEEQNNDTVEHHYVTAGAYRVTLLAQYNDTVVNDIVVVRLGLDPDFSETTTDMEEKQIGICNGDAVKLTGKASSPEWKEQRNYIRTEIFPVYLDDANPYSSYITETYFSTNAQVDSAEDIDSIGIKLEHSLSSSVKITLTCPTGKTAVLKDTGGVGAFMGEPVFGSFNEGTGYWYYFTNNASIKMNDFSGDTIPSGIYLPDSSFNVFEGCPINGNWTLTVNDVRSDTNDGYVFAWALIFDKNRETEKINYQNEYDLDGSLWIGDNLNVTSQGVNTATPEGYGNHNYTFFIKDNWGCSHDTTLPVLVEQPQFDIDKNNVTIGDSIHVTDKTSWAKQWEWDFGDQSEILTDKEEYKKYEDKGTYQVILTAISKSGCKDYDTAEVEVVPKPIEITDYNIFTPNGDGVNDVFKFFNDPDERIIAANIDKITGRIYNRYGEAVCKWDSREEILKGWDGTMNNKGHRPAPDGVYYYILIIKGKDGIKYEPFTGTIYLYRSKK